MVIVGINNLGKVT